MRILIAVVCLLVLTSCAFSERPKPNITISNGIICVTDAYNEEKTHCFDKKQISSISSFNMAKGPYWWCEDCARIYIRGRREITINMPHEQATQILLEKK
ncbi:MAG: hypothetical protein ACXACY_28675 [Candidatus Hodarchaeales archaeon]|jgi:hypothetical protein